MVADEHFYFSFRPGPHIAVSKDITEVGVKNFTVHTTPPKRHLHHECACSTHGRSVGGAVALAGTKPQKERRIRGASVAMSAYYERLYRPEFYRPGSLFLSHILATLQTTTDTCC